MARRRMGLIGVPSSAGAHWPGQEKAPGVLRGAGLVERLESAGCKVVDHGDLPRIRFRPDRGHPQNLVAVMEVARSVAGRVEGLLRNGEIPLVVGGDCTIELGTLSGFLCAGEDPALLYFDGGLGAHPPDGLSLVNCGEHSFTPVQTGQDRRRGARPPRSIIERRRGDLQRGPLVHLQTSG